MGKKTFKIEYNDPIRFIHNIMIFDVLDEPEPNVLVEWHQNGVKMAKWGVAGDGGRDRHTLEQARSIWRTHVVVGYKRAAD